MYRTQVTWFLKFGSGNFISRLEKPITSNLENWTSFLAIPSPMPPEAPVTIAIVPSNFSIFVI